MNVSTFMRRQLEAAIINWCCYEQLWMLKSDRPSDQEESRSPLSVPDRKKQVKDTFNHDNKNLHFQAPRRIRRT